MGSMTDTAEALAETQVTFEALDHACRSSPRPGTGCGPALGRRRMLGARSRLGDSGCRHAHLRPGHGDQGIHAHGSGDGRRAGGSWPRAWSNTVAVLKSKARAKSVAVAIELEPGLPRVRGFAGELNQIWGNLIDNALDAVPEGGPRRGTGTPRTATRSRAHRRQWPRHSRADSRAHLRSVFHHQADGAGHRPGPRHRAPPRPPQRRRNHRSRVRSRAARSFASPCRSPRLDSAGATQ